MKNEKGITLVALIVIIIVLLILAGISITMLTGDNGLLAKVQDAKEKTEQAKTNERLDLLKQEELIDEVLNGVNVEKVTDNKPGELEKENENTFIINSIEDLVFFAYDVTNGNNYEGKTVKLGTSLDFNSTKSYVDPLRTDYGKYGYDGELKTLLTTKEGFIPIGVGNDEVGENSFSGIFYGQNNKIINLYINNNKDIKLGLFSVNYGMVKDLYLVDIDIKRKDENSYSTGGIAGQNRENAEINNCYITGKINIDGSDAVGGIVGHNMGTIKNCKNKANITLDNNINKNVVRVAGICATNSGNIEDCYNSGNITVKIKNILEEITPILIGGIAGHTSKSVIGSCNLGNINANIDCLGSAVLETQVGGISGSVAKNTVLQNNYNKGNLNINVNRGQLYLGGIVGKTIDTYFYIIRSNYNVGRLDGTCNEKEYIGGIAAIYKSVDNSYYLNQNDFTNVGKGAGEIKTEEEMKSDNFLRLLNNGENIWKRDTNNINNGYPILYWQ